MPLAAPGKACAAHCSHVGVERGGGGMPVPRVRSRLSRRACRRWRLLGNGCAVLMSTRQPVELNGRVIIRAPGEGRLSP